MAIKERKQITGTEAQIKGYAGHNGVLAYATDTKHLHVLSGTAGTTTELANVSDIPDTNELVPKTGNRGVLAGYEMSTEGTTVNSSSPDTQHSIISDVTVENGKVNSAWTKVVTMLGGSVSLSGDSWAWSGGKAPELKFPGVLVCHWNGWLPKGIASFISGAS